MPPAVPVMQIELWLHLQLRLNWIEVPATTHECIIWLKSTYSVHCIVTNTLSNSANIYQQLSVVFV